MHDTYLLNRISQSLEGICKEYKMKRIHEFSIIVNHHSHINEESLREHLQVHNKEISGDEVEIQIQRENIEDQTAIIHNIQGELLEE